MAGPQSAAEFFGGGAPSQQDPAAGGALPSAQQFFGLDKPQAGPAMDQIWSSARSAGARVLNAMGYGAQDGWGSRPLGLPAQAETALRQAGVFNDYQSGHDSLVKSFNEAIIRPAASAVDALMRAPSAALTAIGAGAEQTEREAAAPDAQNPGLVRRAIAGAAGAAGELSYGAAEGAIFPDLAA